MSVQLITKYYADVEKVIRYGGSTRETAIRSGFQNLLNDYAQQQNLLLIPELEYKTPTGKTVVPDGTLKDALRLDWGYWESKDSNDDLEAEIVKKFRKGYPSSNILFEDGQTAILYQKAVRADQCDISDPERLHVLLSRFVNYTRAEVRDFRDAIERFKGDLPQVVETLRLMISKQAKENKPFIAARQDFLEVCQTVINADVTVADVHEMLIQHILTEEIFTTVFDDQQFHQENNISKELQRLEKTFFTGRTKRATLESIKSYYQVIKARAAEIANHVEKQKFLKVVYENFYKAYNPKGADRLGIVYTPDEIVKFMIESTDHLLHTHFEKTLGSKNVEILDPATGTGTFVCDLIEYLPKQNLTYKYKNEIHCNEVAILPYYIANLNIEATYKQKMGVYEEFKSICFVDTLDNTDALEYTHKQQHMFSISAENAERVKRQNRKKISVIIGNPPYNAKQENFNFQNANRFYESIDKRIRNTYVKEGKAQNQSTVFDPYMRFVRWATDRIDSNGIVAFITNRSYIDSMAFDGFRKCAQQEFFDIYIVDTRSDVRANPKISGTKYNVFGIQTGVAIMFLVKKESKKPKATIHYYTLQDEQTKKEKLAFFGSARFSELSFERITPDKKNNWLNLTDNDFDDLMPLMNKAVKSGKQKNDAVFINFSSGLQTKRDPWAQDIDPENLKKKIDFLITIYNKEPLNDDGSLNVTIKWDEHLKQAYDRGIKIKFDADSIKPVLYRPYFSQFVYYDRYLNSRTFQWPSLYNAESENHYICMNGAGMDKPFSAISSSMIIDVQALPNCQCVALYRFDSNGNKSDNITDWALKQFQEQYKNKKLTKEDIFYYVYGVLHNPAYRKKYEQNLKREFPRIPFYEDFKVWRDWGKKLMELHVNFEKTRPFKLERIDRAKTKPVRRGKDGTDHQLPDANLSADAPKPRLKADKDQGTIEIDEETSLSGIPAEVWEYKLGNRSAVEWVLEQYKESKPKDPTIREHFNTYRFADYKEQVIELIGKVTTVSVETVKIVRLMSE
jgi:predicted helicase